MEAEITEYYAIAPRICEKIDKLGAVQASARYAAIWKNSLLPAFNALKSDNYQKAHDTYKEMVIGLKHEFFGQ